MKRESARVREFLRWMRCAWRCAEREREREKERKREREREREKRDRQRGRETYDIMLEQSGHFVGLEKVERHLDLVALLEVCALHLMVHLLLCVVCVRERASERARESEGFRESARESREW